MEEVPSDIMGDGTSTNPVVEVPVAGDGTTIPARPSVEEPVVNNRKQRCIDNGNRWSDDGNGACFEEAPPIPRDPPEERTGGQRPADDHTHRVVDPTASSGGSHSGKDGSKTSGTTDAVIEFDSGGYHATIPQKNDVLFMLNNIRALTDPYQVDKRACVFNKRLVE